MERMATRSALRGDTAMLGMLLLLMAEAMLFAGVISAALVLRARTSGGWPDAGQPRLPEGVTLANMAVLLASGAVLWLARGRAWRVALAAGLGVVFLGVQGYEWSRLLSLGMRGSSSAFAGVFYCLIGLHALHVAGGLACLAWAWRGLAAGRLGGETLKVCSLYWYFIVGVWPLVYLVLYG